MPVVITGMMGWLMLEAYLGIVAACLPSIRFLFKGFSPESVINSIRSALSLHSLRSNHSRMNDDGTGSQRGLQARSQESGVDNVGGVELKKPEHAHTAVPTGAHAV